MWGRHSFRRDITKSLIASMYCAARWGTSKCGWLEGGKGGSHSLHFHADWDCSRIRSNFYRKVFVEAVGERERICIHAFSINQREARATRAKSWATHFSWWNLTRLRRRKLWAITNLLILSHVLIMKTEAMTTLREWVAIAAAAGDHREFYS